MLAATEFFLRLELKSGLDRIDAIVLGCAGMSNLTEWLSCEAGMPVIDGCLAGLKIIEGLVGAGFATSKAGAYAWPRRKD